MAKEEAKAEGKGEAQAAPAAKAPMFSKTGLILLVVLCAAFGIVPTILLKPKGDGAHGGKEPSETHEAEPGAHRDPKVFHAPAVCNTVELDEISMPYRESSAGGPRRNLRVTVVLEVVTKAVTKEKAGGEGAVEIEVEKGQEKEHEDDVARLHATQKLKHRIYDKICNILRGRVPEDFATNELIDQTRQQIRRTLNDEIFENQEVIQGVLFTKSQF